MVSLLNKNFKCRGRRHRDDEILQPSHSKFMSVNCCKNVKQMIISNILCLYLIIKKEGTC